MSINRAYEMRFAVRLRLVALTLGGIVAFAGCKSVGTKSQVLGDGSGQTCDVNVRVTGTALSQDWFTKYGTPTSDRKWSATVTKEAVLATSWDQHFVQSVPGGKDFTLGNGVSSYFSIVYSPIACGSNFSVSSDKTILVGSYTNSTNETVKLYGVKDNTGTWNQPVHVAGNMRLERQSVGTSCGINIGQICPAGEVDYCSLPNSSAGVHRCVKKP